MCSIYSTLSLSPLLSPLPLPSSSPSLSQTHRYSEKSRIKCIGITIETRPDYCLRKHLSQMLTYGCTRLEIGVQSVYEDVARDTNRSATILEDTSSNVVETKLNKQLSTV